MMVAGVWPFVVDWLVFMHTDLHLCKCFLVAGYDRLHCCLPLVSKVQPSITHTLGDQVGQVYGNAGFCFEPGCNGWVLLVSHGFAFWWIMIACIPRSSNMSCEDALLRHDHREGCGRNRQVCFLFPSPSGDILHAISVIGTSVLKPDVWTRLVNDFAKAMLGVQDAKEIVPAPPHVTTTFLGITAWWKQGSPFQVVSPGFGFSCFKMAQNL